MRVEIVFTFEVACGEATDLEMAAPLTARQSLVPRERDGEPLKHQVLSS